MRVIRMLKIARLKVFLQWMRDLLHLNPGVVRLATFIVSVVVIAHYSACLFFYFGEFMLDEAVLDEYKATGVYDPRQAHAVISWTTQEFVTVPDKGIEAGCIRGRVAATNGTQEDCSARVEVTLNPKP